MSNNIVNRIQEYIEYINGVSTCNCLYRRLEAERSMERQEKHYNNKRGENFYFWMDVIDRNILSLEAEANIENVFKLHQKLTGAFPWFECKNAKFFRQD